MADKAALSSLHTQVTNHFKQNQKLRRQVIGTVEEYNTSTDKKIEKTIDRLLVPMSKAIRRMSLVEINRDMQRKMAAEHDKHKVWTV